MRSLKLLTLLALAATAACGQGRHSSTEPGPPAGDTTTLFRNGVARFEQGDYARAARLFRLRFAQSPAEDAAGYLYRALLHQGYDLEAADFARRAHQYTFAITPQPRGFESGYITAGPRISANSNADNLFYGDLGATLRISRRLRLWQSLLYLRQNENPGRLRQYEYFGALSWYAGRGWQLQPALHYDYVPYTFIVRSTQGLSFSSGFSPDHRDTFVFRTTAVQNITTTIPGATHFIHLSLPLSRHCGAFTMEAEPAAHYIAGASTLQTQYVTTGTTDSFKNNRYGGTRPFMQEGSTVGDTTYSSLVMQAGLALSGQLFISRKLITIRAAAYYLHDDAGHGAWAWHASASVPLQKNALVYLTWLKKGGLPLGLRAEGQYFNFYDPVETRAGLTVQLFPQRHLSPFITYQYEHDTRQADGAALVFHSLYLSLKYRL